MITQTFTGTLVVQDCCSCGMTFGVADTFDRARRSDKATFYCPAGHGQCYTGKSDSQIARDAQEKARLAQESEAFYRRQAQAWEQKAAAQRRAAITAKAARTRALNLITKGICPAPGCRRNFTNVREHMASEHPDFHTHEDGAR